MQHPGADDGDASAAHLLHLLLLLLLLLLLPLRTLLCCLLPVPCGLTCCLEPVGQVGQLLLLQSASAAYGKTCTAADADAVTNCVSPAALSLLAR
jgi:hypothetical protein